jgi:Pyridoxamine 5'-phosphate oxidase
MASWRAIEESAPELAARARGAFDAHKHKVLATLRRDGSPRISGIEASFEDGELWLGMMPGSRKALELRREPRLALHSASDDPPDDPTVWTGDAKLAGRAVEVDDPALLERLGAGDQAGAEEADRAHLFRVDITELVHTRVGDPADHLVIDLWQEGKGLRRMRRR